MRDHPEGLTPAQLDGNPRSNISMEARLTNPPLAFLRDTSSDWRFLLLSIPKVARASAHVTFEHT